MTKELVLPDGSLPDGNHVRVIEDGDRVVLNIMLGYRNTGDRSIAMDSYTQLTLTRAEAAALKDLLPPLQDGVAK